MRWRWHGYGQIKLFALLFALTIEAFTDPSCRFARRHPTVALPS